jgi:hypothetical protein
MNLEAPLYHGGARSYDHRASEERIQINVSAAPEPTQQIRSTRKANMAGQPKLVVQSKVADVTTSSEVTATRNPQQPQSVPIGIVEMPASGTNPELLKRPPKIKKGQELDYYHEPTLLGRLILGQKYGRAIKRVFDHPDEASTWLCSKRRMSNTVDTAEKKSPNGDEVVYTIRQLPIHMACSNLGRTKDFQIQRLLNELISLLVFAFPEGAHEVDHRNILPIQEAVWYGAAPETIALFLMARPEALFVADHLGRSLGELNRYRAGPEREAVQQMLCQNISFWNTARKEATFRLQHNSTSYPSDNQSVSSESVLASPNADEETITSTVVPEHTTEVPNYEDNITPLSWGQLEKRAIAAEQLLDIVNEENYKLRKQLETLTTSISSKNSDFTKELVRLSRENSALSEKIYKLENLLEKLYLSEDVEKNQQFRSALAEISSLVGLSDKSSLRGGGPPSRQSSLKLLGDANKLQKELSQKHRQQREKIRKLRHIVTEYISNVEVDDDDNDISEATSYADVTTISALTSHSAKSDVTSIILRRRWHYNQGVVDRLPTKSTASGHDKVVDDLSVILRYAASRQAQAGRHRSNLMDDLSAMLRWAASNDVRGRKNPGELSVQSDWSPINARDQLKRLKAKTKLSPNSAFTREINVPPLLSATQTIVVTEIASGSDQGQTGVVASSLGQSQVSKCFDSLSAEI